MILTPEEQETIQKSKDPSVINMFVQFQKLKESPAVLSLGTLCEENGYSNKWHPGLPSYLIQNGKKVDCKTDNHIPLIVPNVQATEHQTVSSGRPEADTSCGPERLQPFMEGLTRGGDRQVRQIYLPLTWPSHFQRFLLPQILLQTIQKEITMYSFIFPKGPNCEVCRRTKVTRAPCRRNPDDRADRMKIAERFGDMIIAARKVLHEEQESRLHHKYAVVVQDLTTQRIQSYPNKTKPA